jgi:hypothetical protein
MTLKDDMLKINEINEMFKDARVASPWVTEWVLRHLGRPYRKATTDEPGVDAYIAFDGINTEPTECRCLTTGVFLGQQKNVGSGRTCDLNDVRSSLRYRSQYLITDITQRPILKTIKVPVTVVKNWIENGYVSSGGRISYNNFWSLVAQDMDVTWKNLT